MSSSELGNVVYLFHPSFMTLAVQKDMDVKVFDRGAEGRRSFRVNSTVLYGLKQLDDQRVVQIG